MMGRRLVGTILFLGASVSAIEVAGGLARSGRSGWGWFLLAGMVLAGVALNLWEGDDEASCADDRRKPEDHGGFD